jgi:DNA-binding MarR family transcriptional regulator
MGLSIPAGNLTIMSNPGDGNDLKSPENMVGVMMSYILRRMQNEADRDLLPHGMKTRHAVVLTLLRDLGEQPQSELPQALGIDATGVVALLNGLEDEGLIERRRSPEDRRRHNVLITKAGRRRLADIEHVAADLEQQLLGLEPTELRTLHTLLAKAMTNLVNGQTPHGQSAAAR